MALSTIDAPLKITAGGDTAAGDDAAIGVTAAEGLILTGQGTTSDITIKNDADATIMSVATGTVNTVFTGNVTATDAMLLTGATPTLTIGDAGAEDAKIVFDGNAQDYHIGLDDSADTLVIGKGSALGTTTSMSFDANGIITKPLQPAFLARPASDQDNPDVNSGNAIDIVFGTEIFDQNGDFASNTFTAPVTGKYYLSTSLRLQNTDMDNAFYAVEIVTSNRSYQNLLTLTGFDEDMSFLTLGVDSLADMDAGDTAKVILNANASGNDTVDVDVVSNFSGALIC